MSEALYRKYRPKQLKDVVGQDHVVTALRARLKAGTLPHALLLCGPSGTGKTTLARILGGKLGCRRLDDASLDWIEVNAAEARGIDTVRDIAEGCAGPALGGRVRVYCLDEAHCLTREAQSALLKLLEDMRSHVYFMICTTDPEKVIKTVRSRCTAYALKPIPGKLVEDLVRATAAAEGRTLSTAVVDAVADAADGSARQALVILEEVLHQRDEAAQLAAAVPEAVRKTAVDLMKALLWNQKAKWPEVAAVLRNLEEGKEEQVRRAILTMAANEMLKEGSRLVEKANLIIDSFQFDFFQSGRAGLVHKVFMGLDTKRKQ